MTKLRVHLDFESRSACDLKKRGAWIYSKHPTTSLMCTAFAPGDADPVLLPRGEQKSKALRELARDPEVLFVAHNAGFEFVMWLHQMVPLGYPLIPINRWRCTSAKASAMGLPKSLDAVGKILRLPITKDTEGYQIMMRLCKPIGTLADSDDDFVWDNSREKYEKLYSYCRKDVEVERLIDNKIPDLSPLEQKIWEINLELNTRGIYADADLIDSAMAMSGQLKSDANLEIKRLSGYAINKFTEVKKIITWLQTRGHEIESLTVDDLDEWIDKVGSDQIAREVLTIRKNMARASVAKFFAFNEALDRTDSRLRDIQIFHGSTTGRFTSGGAQYLNLAKAECHTSLSDDEKGPAMDALCSDIKLGSVEYLDQFYQSANHAIGYAVRGALMATPGKKLYCVDFAQIEARVLFLLSGEIKGLLQFASGEDLYVAMARVIYDDPNITKKTDPDKRQLGKQAVLGCGYQMGAKRFAETCATYGIIITEELAIKAVRAYRETYSTVKEFWFECENAAKRAIEHRTTVEVGMLKFGFKSGALMMRLPSGRIIYYHQPKIEYREVTEEARKKIIEDGEEWKLEKKVITYCNQNPITKQWSKAHTYGGKLVENATQAAANDLMKFAMVAVHKTGRYHILLTPHDEILTEGFESECSVKELEKLVCQLPPWAEGLPIAAEGWEGMRYRK